MTGFHGFYQEGSDCIYCRESGTGLFYCEIHDGCNCEGCDDYACDDGTNEKDIDGILRNFKKLWGGKITFGKFGTDRLPAVMIETPTSIYLVSACQFIEYLHQSSIKCFDKDGNEVFPEARKPFPEDVKFGGTCNGGTSQR